MSDLQAVIDKLRSHGPDLPVSEDECPCYKCADPEYVEHDGHQTIKNNMEYHTYGEPCNECGTERTKYRDLGTKGRYVCPNCR